MLLAAFDHLWLRCVLSLGVLTCSAPILARSSSDHTWHLERYDVRNGLPQSSVHDLAQDSMGFLWLATETGLIRFDGHNLRSVQVVPNGNLLGTRTRSIFTSALGEIMVDDWRGSMWKVESHSTAVKIRGNDRQATVIGGATRTGQLLGLIDSLDRILPGTEPIRLSLVPLDGGRFAMLLGDTLVVSGGHATEVRSYCPGARWIVELGGTIHVIQADGRNRKLLATGELSPMQAIEPPQGAPWNGKLDALFWKLGYHYPLVMSGGKLHRLGATRTGLVLEALDLPELASVHVTSACALEGGQLIAVGTTNQGLLIFRKHWMRTLLTPDAAKDANSFYAMSDLGNGTFLAHNNGEVWSVDHRSGTMQRTHAPRLAQEGLSDVHEGKVLGSASGSLYEYDSGTGVWHRVDSSGHGACVFHTEGERTWLVDKHRIGYWEAGRYVETGRTVPGGLANDPQGILRLPDGRSAYASADGLFIERRGDPGVFEVLAGTADLQIRGLALIQGHLFLGTYGMGLYVLSPDDDLRQAPLDPWSALSHTHSVLEVGDDIWIGTNRGILRVGSRALLGSLRSGSDQPGYTQFGIESGMAVQELNGGCSRAALLLKDGTVVFPSLRGLVVFNPEDAPARTRKESVLLGNVLVNEELFTPRGPYVFPHGTLSVELEVSSTRWEGYDRPHYEYRIPGVVERWTALPRNADRIRIERPPGGSHALFLRPIGATDLGTRPAWEFEVEEPWYLTTPGIFVLLFLISLLWFLGNRINSARLRRRNRMLENYARAHSSELAERNQQLSDALRNRETLLSIISHDIVTPLGFVARVSRQTERLHAQSAGAEILSENLKDLTASADKLHVNAKAALDWLRMNPERITVAKKATDLTGLVDRSIALWREMAGSKGIALHNEVPIGTEVFTDPQVLSVILNNVLGNCVGHNIGAHKVSIRVLATDNGMSIIVTDDGRGMDIGTYEQAKRGLRHAAVGTVDRFLRGDAQGLGFIIMGSLAPLLDASIDIRTSPSGTSISIRI